MIKFPWKVNSSKCGTPQRSWRTNFIMKFWTLMRTTRIRSFQVHPLKQFGLNDWKFQEITINIFWTACKISIQSSFIHNSWPSRWIQQNKIYKEFIDITRNLTWITYLTVSQSKHYTQMVSVVVCGSNWILFSHEWFCRIHLIGQKSLDFEKIEFLFLNICCECKILKN